MLARAERVPGSRPRRYRVVITEGVQSFRLDYDVPSLGEARWMAKMFNHALDRHTWRHADDLVTICGAAGFVLGGFLGFVDQTAKGGASCRLKTTSAALPASGK